MRDKRVLLGMLLSIFAFGGLCSAASSTSSLSMNVTPDMKDVASRFEFRTTTTLDTNSNVLYTGAVDAGTKEYAVTAVSTADSGATITKTPLAPALIYSNPSDTSAALIANPVYNARIWELAHCFYGTTGKKYVAAIVQSSTDSGNGGSFIAVINTADPKETYVSANATTLENEVAGTAGTASKFVKLAVGVSGASRVVFGAVADPVTGEFDTSKSTSGLRAYTAPSASLSNSSLVEFDMNSGGVAGTKGVKLGNTSGPLLMSTQMKRLTSLVWDWNNSVLYFGGYMRNGYMGIAAFYLNSGVLTSLNHSAGGTLFNADSATPEFSHVHRLVVGKVGASTPPYLIVQAGFTPRDKSKVYALNLVHSVAAASDGKIAQSGNTTVATARTSTVIALPTNGTYTLAARAVVGNAPLPLPAGSLITHMSVGLNGIVYVATYSTNGSVDVWGSLATVSTYVTAWGGWKRMPTAALTKVTFFGTDTVNGWVWSVLDRKSVYVNSTLPATVTVAQPSLGLANVKDSTARTRLRQIAAFDTVNRVFVTASTTAPGAGVTPVSSFSTATRATTASASESVVSPLLNAAIWDMATITNNSGVVDKYYLVNNYSNGGNVSGGTIIVKVPGDGSAITSISAAGVNGGGYTGDTTNAAFFTDAVSGSSRCVKIVAGKRADDSNVLFCFIPETGSTDAQAFNGGNSLGNGVGEDDVIKVLDANLGVIAASYTFRSSLGALAGYVVGMQCVHFDPVSKVLYIGLQKGSGNEDPGLVRVTLSGTSFTANLVFPNGWGNGAVVGTDDSVKDIYKMATLRTVGTTSRCLLLMAGTLNGDAGDTNTGGIYAIPVQTAAGANLGRAAQANYTSAATYSNTTWCKNSSPSYFYVGGAQPWSIQAAVLDIQVLGLDVYVTIANPPGVTGLSGVFRTTAVCDSAGALVGWTPWTAVAGLGSSMQNFAIDNASGKLIGLDLASGQPVVPTWKQSSESSSYDQLADALNTDFSDNGGVYNVATHRMSHSMTYSNASGLITVSGVNYNSATAEILVATGNKKVAIAHVGFKNESLSQQVVNANKSDLYTYKCYSSDTALQALGQVYCSTASRGLAGWVFVGGKNGVAVLRVSGSGAHAGKGWTGTVPSSLLDATSSTVGLADMTWLKVPGITDSIRKMTVVYDKTTGAEVVVAMGTTGVYAFTTSAAKFDDDITTTVPTIVSLTSFTSGASERVWDIAPLYHRGGNLLVGTTKGLYRVQFDNGAWTTPVEIFDSVNSASLGAISSIHVTAPFLGTGTDLSVSPICVVNCVTAKARTDAGNHYRFPVTLAETTGVVSGTPAAVLVRALDRMASQIVVDGGVTTYHAGKPTARAASVDVLAKTLEASGAAVSDGLTAAKGSSMGSIAVVGADGTKIVTVGGRVYVQSA